MRPVVIAIVGALALLVGAGAVAAYMAAGPADVVSPGVTVMGAELGGLDAEAAADVVEAVADSRLGRTLILAADGDGGLEATPADLGVEADVGATVSAALAVGDREGGVARVIDRIRTRLRGHAIPLVLTVDDARWLSSTDEVALQCERLVKDARLVLVEGRPKAVAAEPGSALDRDMLRAMVLQAVLEDGGTVELPLAVVEPAVDTGTAQAALAVARDALAEPVTLGYRGREYVIAPEELAAIADVDPAGTLSGLPLTFDTDDAREHLGARLAEVEDPPVDAVIVPVEGGKGFDVTPSADGTVIEWSALLETLARVVVEDERRYVPIPTTPAYPKLTTADAQELGTRHEIASFTTFFSPANSARVHNIRQVGAILDGIVVRPGETFSFNAAVGPRTKAAGFDEAPVIRDGVLTPGVGGGICQVSTTLFNAVFFAGLPVVERRPHSFFIDHYPIGRDATVSYGSVDFKFRNDSDTVLLLSVGTTDNSVTVSLAAPSWDRRVEYETSEFYDLVQPRSTAERPRRLRDPGLAAGTVSELEAGVSGRTVDVRRVVTGAGGATLIEDEFRSTYGPKDFVVRVGG